MGQARLVPGDEPAPPDTGAAALEFALVSPLLFMLLFMIFGAGWGLWEYQAARATAREAARLAAIGIPDINQYEKGIVCIGERNGMRAQALTGVQLSFHTDSSLSGLGGANPLPGGFIELQLTYRSALNGVVFSPFTDDDGTFATTAVARVENVDAGDIDTDQSLTVSGETCS